MYLGEFGHRVASGRILDTLKPRGLPSTWYVPGFTIESHPAAQPVLVGAGERIAVFLVRERLSQGPEAAEAWRSFCADAGIADVDLGSVGDEDSHATSLARQPA